MRRIHQTVLLLIVGGITVGAQEPAPPILIHAAHCLAVKNFLPSARTPRLTFGYFLDEKSYPGERVVYVVQYATPAHTNGSVFSIFLTTRDGRQDFNIQNNASFLLSKREVHGVSFVEPPLGGTWTQEHLASAIEQIEKEPRFIVSFKALAAQDVSVGCESYTDR